MGVQEAQEQFGIVLAPLTTLARPKSNTDKYCNSYKNNYTNSDKFKCSRI